jgi:hypothetical protein
MLTRVRVHPSPAFEWVNYTQAPVHGKPIVDRIGCNKKVYSCQTVGFLYTSFHSKESEDNMLFIFRVDYSQTDSSMVIVQAKTREQAEAWLKRHGEHGPRYVTFYGAQEKPIKALE